MKKDKTPFPLKIVRFLFPLIEKVVPFLAHRLFIQLFFTPLKYPLPEKERLVQARAVKFEVRANENKKIQCYSWGDGPVVLFVHGWAGRGTQFRKFFEPLNRAGYRVIAFDGPAHGSSEGKQTNLMEFHAALTAISLAVGPIEAIVAHSFGGSASLYSIMNGLPVNTLINIASPTIGDEIIKTYLRAIGASWKTAEFFKSHVLKKTGKRFEEFTSMHFIKHLPHDLNLLLIHDKEDQDVPVYQALELQKNYPTAQLYITEGLGHTRILKDDKTINKSVTFIKEYTSV